MRFPYLLPLAALGCLIAFGALAANDKEYEVIVSAMDPSCRQ